MTSQDLNLLAEKEESSQEYIQAFWVGLLEGDGTITVSKNKSSKTLKVRIVISLLNFKENLEMLNLILKYMGGRVVIERNNRYVTWIASNKSDLIKAFKVLDKYPLLTSRKQYQLKFALSCLSNPDMFNYRNNKYDFENSEGVLIVSDCDLIPYFKPWLSGFIEAEGSFSLILNDSGCPHIKKCKFSIGQNTDRFILDLIKQYFHCTHVITIDKPKHDSKFKHYRMSLSGSNFRAKLIQHLNVHPLLGYKKVSYEKWVRFFVNRNKL